MLYNTKMYLVNQAVTWTHHNPNTRRLPHRPPVVSIICGVNSFVSCIIFIVIYSVFISWMSSKPGGARTVDPPPCICVTFHRYHKCISVLCGYISVNRISRFRFDTPIDGALCVFFTLNCYFYSSSFFPLICYSYDEKSPAWPVEWRVLSVLPVCVVLPVAASPGGHDNNSTTARFCFPLFMYFVAVGFHAMLLVSFLPCFPFSFFLQLFFLVTDSPSAQIFTIREVSEFELVHRSDVHPLKMKNTLEKPWSRRIRWPDRFCPPRGS